MKSLEEIWMYDPETDLFYHFVESKPPHQAEIDVYLNGTKILNSP